jgi:ATP-dependent Clp protease, protease subunit
VKAATKSPLQIVGAAPRFAPERLIEYFGIVNYATNERVLGDIKQSLINWGEVALMVTSAGGPSGTAMSFYDAVRSVLRAEITTIGSGDVDSSGLIIFLAGTQRFVTPHTTALLHPAGRQFSEGTRYTTQELAAMLYEDTKKDELYADIVANASHGKLSAAEVLNLMKMQTVLTAEDFVRFDLAEAVL